MIRLHDEKDIDSIFFYAINNDVNHLGFRYTANYKKYELNYKDFNFKGYVDRIKYVYNILKDTKKVKLIGDLTKDILDGKIEIADDKIYNKTIINTEKYDFYSMIDYIKLIIEHSIISLGIDIENATWDISNRNENSYIKIKTNDNTINVPISFYKIGQHYKLNYSIMMLKMIHENNIYQFTCDIKCFDKSIIADIKSDQITATAIFDKLNISNDIIFRKNDDIIHYYSSDNDLEEIDIQKISNAFNLINFNQKINGIKTIKDNYILYDENDTIEYKMKLNIKDDFIKINLKQSNMYNNDDLILKYDNELYDILITKLDDNHILIQQKYLANDNLSSESKMNIGKSRYYVLTTKDKINKISDNNEIIDRYEVNDNVSNIEDIKSLILK